jgi:MFS family permease
VESRSAPSPEPPVSAPTSAPTPIPLLGGPIVQRLAAALGYRDFRVLWLGACTSSIGTWMQKVAQSWLVLEITDSASYLALDAFLGELPGGVVADRRDRRRLLLASQVVQMISAFALAILVVGGWVHIWHVLALSFLSGCAQAFGGPAYQSLVPSLVHKDHLPNAVALNSIQFNIARVIGPLLAGVTLHTLGSASCFTVNGLSFLVVIAALLSLRTPQVAPAGQRRMMDELRTGLVYVRDQAAVRRLTLLALASTFLGVPLLTFLPVFARNVFHEGVGQYSQMMAWSGIGAVAGALVVAWLGRFAHMGRTALTVQVLFGALTVAFALLTSLVQLIAPNEMRGRVMSIYMVAFRGGMPLGSLVTGLAIDRVGAPAAIAVNGLLLTAVALWFLVRRDVPGDE